jgi:hypothetical protein
MKLVMTLLVRDEEDILATHIEFHLSRGVDFFIATDNLSADATPEILAHYERRGVLRTIRESSDDYSQHAWVTRMARMAAVDHDVGWVINSDADEFWWPDAGATLKGALATLPAAAAAASVERTNFLPRPETQDGFFAETMTVRETRSLNAVGDPLPAKVCHRAHPEIVVLQGNHFVKLGGELVDAVPAPLSILHFPLRSYAGFENKIAKGGAAYERNTKLGKEVGVTWRELYASYRAGGLRGYYDSRTPTEDELRQGLRDGSYVRDARLREFVGDRIVSERIRRIGRGMPAVDGKG